MLIHINSFVRVRSGKGRRDGKTEHPSPLPRGYCCEQTTARWAQGWIAFIQGISPATLTTAFWHSAFVLYLPPRRAAQDPRPFAGQRCQRSSLREPQEKQANTRPPRRGHGAHSELLVWSDIYGVWTRIKEFNPKSIHNLQLWQSPFYLHFCFQADRTQKYLGFPTYFATGIAHFPHSHTSAVLPGAPGSHNPSTAEQVSSVVPFPHLGRTASMALEVRNWHRVANLKSSSIFSFFPPASSNDFFNEGELKQEN